MDRKTLLAALAIGTVVSLVTYMGEKGREVKAPPTKPAPVQPAPKPAPPDKPCPH